MSKAEILAELERMPMEERIEVRDRLDAMIDARSWDPEVSPEEIAVLEERIAEYNRNPDDVLDWDETIAELKAELENEAKAKAQ